MNKEQVVDLLTRMDSVYRTQPRPQEQLAIAAEEWLAAVRHCNSERMRGALARYNRERHRFAPRISDLLDIYQEEERELRQKDLANAEICPICGGVIGRNNYAMVDGNIGGYYGCGIDCPCRNSAKLSALMRGIRVRHKCGKSRKDGSKVFVGELELQLVNGRLYGEVIHGFSVDNPVDNAVEPPKPQSRQAGLFGMSDLTAAMAAESETAAEHEDDLPF